MNGVKRTEVATNTADFVFEDLVVETGFEFTLAGGGGRDIHGGLTTSQDHVVLLGSDHGGVEGSIGDVGFHDGEVAAGHKLGYISMLSDNREKGTYLGGLVF